MRIRTKRRNNIQYERLDNKSCPRALYKSFPSKGNASPERLIVSSAELYTILHEGLRFPKKIKLSHEGLIISSCGKGTQESHLQRVRDIQSERLDNKSGPRA